MPAEVRITRKPEKPELRKAILTGIATAIIEETKKAFEARANSDYYEEAATWRPISSTWLEFKVKRGFPSQIGIYRGGLEKAILNLSFTLSGNSLRIKVENEHAEAFDAIRPLIYVPPMDVIQDYIEASIREQLHGS